MKHKWEIKPRGKKTKYYFCLRCEELAVACSKKEADSFGECLATKPKEGKEERE